MKSGDAHISEIITELGCQRDAELSRLEFDDLSPPDQVFLAIWELKSEVYNGGLWQYSINWSGRLVPFICDALKKVGAVELVPVLEEAIAVVGPGVPWGHEVKRHPIIVNLPKDKRKRLTDLDNKLFDYFDELDVLIFNFLRKHRDQVDVPEEFWKDVTIQ
jgi:hypothetical protein